MPSLSVGEGRSHQAKETRRGSELWQRAKEAHALRVGSAQHVQHACRRRTLEAKVWHTCKQHKVENKGATLGADTHVRADTGKGRSVLSIAASKGWQQEKGKAIKQRARHAHHPCKEDKCWRRTKLTCAHARKVWADKRRC